MNWCLAKIACSAELFFYIFLQVHPLRYNMSQNKTPGKNKICGGIFEYFKTMYQLDK